VCWYIGVMNVGGSLPRAYGLVGVELADAKSAAFNV